MVVEDCALRPSVWASVDDASALKRSLPVRLVHVFAQIFHAEAALAHGLSVEIAPLGAARHEEIYGLHVVRQRREDEHKAHEVAVDSINPEEGIGGEILQAAQHVLVAGVAVDDGAARVEVVEPVVVVRVSGRHVGGVLSPVKLVVGQVEQPEACRSGHRVGIAVSGESLCVVDVIVFGLRLCEFRFDVVGPWVVCGLPRGGAGTHQGGSGGREGHSCQ